MSIPAPNHFQIQEFCVMTESDTTYTSVLLPVSRVMMVASDKESVESFKSLSTDWRFTRVQLDHVEGGVADAIAAFKGGTPSPDLLIVETDTIDDSFTAQLETLSQYCSEGTAAIVIGPVNDVNLYRKLIAMGISDYLVRPVKADTLSFDIARTLIERIGATGSRMIAVMGAKGGVGTTVIAEVMAMGTADVYNQKTILLDAAGGWSTLSVGMNFEPAATLAEAVRAAQSGKDDAFQRMVFQSSDKLHVLSTGGDVMLDTDVDAGAYESLVDKLMTTYPVVVVDLSNAPTDLVRIVLTRAHEILLVATPLLPSLRAARTLLQEMKELRADAESRVDLVINMAGMAPKQEVAKADLEAALDRKPAVTLDFNPGLFIAMESEGKKFGGTAESKSVMRSILALAEKILDGKLADGSNPANDDTGKKNPLNSLFSKLKAKA